MCFYLLFLSSVHGYLFNSEESVFVKDFYLQECLHSNKTVCVTIDLADSTLVRTCVSDESQCIGVFSSYLKRSACADCSDFWCEDAFLCTNEESLCRESNVCNDDTPSCYSRGTLNTNHGSCNCANGFTGNSCSECESSPKHPEMEYICCEDNTFEHGIRLIAVKKRDLGEFLEGKYTSGNCTAKVINDCDCLNEDVDHAEEQNPYLFYESIDTNDTRPPKKLGQGLIAFVVSLSVGLMLVCSCILGVYYINKTSNRKMGGKNVHEV